MLIKKEFFIILTLIILLEICSSIPTRNGIHGGEDISERTGYGNFTVDLLQKVLNMENWSQLDVAGVAPLSLAYLLAVAHTQVWPVPTKGLEDVLHLKSSEIIPVYKEIIERVSMQKDLVLDSFVITSTIGHEPPQEFVDLKTNLSYVNFTHSNQAILHLNEELANAAYGENVETLLPLGGWYGASITSLTSGIFLNTFNFRGTWKYPFHKIEPMTFAKTEKIPFLEAIGNFSVYRHQNFRAVRVPFKGTSKFLMIVEPTEGKSIKDFVNEDLKNFFQVHKTELKVEEIPVRLPSFKFSGWNTFTGNLLNTSLASSICEYKPNSNTFDGFGQSSYFLLNEDKFELSYATGANLNNANGFLNPDDEPSSNMRTKRSNYASNLLKKEASSLKRSGKSRNSNGAVILDSSFIWWLEDETLGLGPLAIGSLDTKAFAKKDKVEDGFEWLLELAKYSQWSCASDSYQFVFKNPVSSDNS